MKKILFLILFTTTLFSTDLSKYFLNKNNCNILYKTDIYLSCYDTTFKGTKAVEYNVNYDLANKNNYKKRPSWKYPDMDKEYLPDLKKYVYSGYDIGHLANDANFDYKTSILKQTYLIGVNGVPMTPKLNRYYWRKAEYMTTKLTNLYENIIILDIIKYSNNKLKDSNMFLPSTFYKVYIIGDKDTLCLKYINDDSLYDSTDQPFKHRIKCSDLIKDYND